jgi:CDP-glucose 4,6-dehydratase
MDLLGSRFHATYSGKTVLLTGHTGFKGVWMSTWLSELGATVIGFSLEDHDVRDLDSLKAVIAESNPDIIFHMAAQALVGHSYDDPMETFTTNIMGTVNVFESLRVLGHKAVVVNVTTDKCYQNKHQSEGYVESDSLGGHDPYSASKACSEIVTASYRHSFFKDSGCAIATARAGNVIGGGDWSDYRLLPDFARAIDKHEALTLRSPSAIRPWQHVLDALAGYLLLGSHLLNSPATVSEAFNFSPPATKTKTVEEIIAIMMSCWKKVPITLGTVPFFEHDLLSLDSSKARNILGWSTLLEIEEAVAWTAKWYAAFYDNHEDITLSQIRDYCSLAKTRGAAWA